ncbi:hypothetical protein C2845_PM11G19950 [Panicum miliaceum]|uniref:Citrate synthase n=1 Tax=Panicum miliaceum TaxID=4540 RepID=A0A3L6RVV0_PANMI|nr:hypothetical protein C2845_PM11G19950 [Panicum miliaceum]
MLEIELCAAVVMITTGKDDKGLKIYDPGYLNTAPVRSSICYIDGDEGIFRYRGYPIEELAESSSFVEVAYLLMYGNLPTQSQLASWEFAISQHSAVPQGLLDIIQSMPHDAHPMGVLASAMSTLSVFHPDANPALRRTHYTDGQNLYKSKQVRDKQIVRVLGKTPTIAAAAYLRLAGRPPILPSNALSYSENFLYMLDSLGNKSYKPNPRLARALDILFILHAEHEMNYPLLRLGTLLQGTKTGAEAAQDSPEQTDDASLDLPQKRQRTGDAILCMLGDIKTSFNDTLKSTEPLPLPEITPPVEILASL